MRKLFALTACLGLALVSAPVAAQKPSASEQDGRARFEEGVKLAEAGDHDHARLKFIQAWAVLKHWSVLFNLARAEQLSGHPVEALRHFEEFTRLANPKIPGVQREQAQTYAADLRTKVGRLAIDAPAGAVVTIDAERIDADLAEPVAVTAGAHVVEATAAGRTKSLNVDAPAGVVTKVSLVEAAAPAPVVAAPAPVAPPPPAPPERSRAGYLVPGALGVAGLAGIGVGIGFALKSQSAKDDATRLGQPLVCANRAAASCSAYVDAHDRAHSDATVAWVGYLAGGVLLAGAVGSYLLWPKQQSRTTGLVVVPVLAPGHAAASATYHF